MNTCPCCGQLMRPAISFDAGGMYINGVFHALSPIRTGIIRSLWEKFPSTVTHEQMAVAIYGYDGPESNSLQVTVNYVRRYLKEIEAPFAIENLWGVGYRLVLGEEIQKRGEKISAADVEKIRKDPAGSQTVAWRYGISKEWVRRIRKNEARIDA